MFDIPQIIAENIRILRRVKGITQEKLAEKLEVSGSYIGYLERGKKIPSLHLLAKIADVFQVTPALLLTATDAPANLELKNLIFLLADKSPKTITFIYDVAVAYLKSSETE